MNQKAGARLFAGGNFGGDEADVVNVGGVGDVDDFGNVGEVEVRIALDESDAFGAGGKDGLELGLELTLGDVGLVDLVSGRTTAGAMGDLDNDGAVIIAAADVLSFGGWGTRASNPRGVIGVMVMKMMSSTSKTSMRGVTLMS